MRPGEILDARADLLDRLSNDHFRHTIRVTAAYHMGHLTNEQMGRATDLHTWDRAVDVLKMHALIADAYRCTADMSQMVEFVASQLDDTDQFHRELAPSESGIIGFDRPLPYLDIRGKTMLMHWLVWGPGATTPDGQPGTVVWFFNDTWRQPDEVQKHFEAETTAESGPEAWDRYARTQGRWATVGADVLFSGQRLGPALWNPSGEQAAQVRSEGFEPLPGTNAVRYIHALFLTLGQVMTRMEPEVVDRPARRRAMKMRLPQEVTVIKLRREDVTPRHEGESEVEWQHRWMVKRHLRWQPYGPRTHTDHVHEYGKHEVEVGHLVRHCIHSGCEAHLARIVINAYEKGPAGAPFKQTEKVYSLER